ncbi:hypothetical protein [Mycobacterium hubeiense]|uniref:hypothetical protein n=1 Tax=Mycobacterium hubeiense TaxID=1867256 RepID=UPI001159457A|nr:hypothetical protein [Mycobacterium sp. QGD 101]
MLRYLCGQGSAGRGALSDKFRVGGLDDRVDHGLLGLGVEQRIALDGGDLLQDEPDRRRHRPSQQSGRVAGMLPDLGGVVAGLGQEVVVSSDEFSIAVQLVETVALQSLAELGRVGLHLKKLLTSSIPHLTPPLLLGIQVGRRRLRPRTFEHPLGVFPGWLIV